MPAYCLWQIHPELVGCVWYFCCGNIQALAHSLINVHLSSPASGFTLGSQEQETMCAKPQPSRVIMSSFRTMWCWQLHNLIRHRKIRHRNLCYPKMKLIFEANWSKENVFSQQGSWMGRSWNYWPQGVCLFVHNRSVLILAKLRNSIDLSLQVAHTLSKS